MPDDPQRLTLKEQLAKARLTLKEQLAKAREGFATGADNFFFGKLGKNQHVPGMPSKISNFAKTEKEFYTTLGYKDQVIKGKRKQNPSKSKAQNWIEYFQFHVAIAQRDPDCSKLIASTLTDDGGKSGFSAAKALDPNYSLRIDDIDAYKIAAARKLSHTLLPWSSYPPVNIALNFCSGIFGTIRTPLKHFARVVSTTFAGYDQFATTISNSTIGRMGDNFIAKVGLKEPKTPIGKFARGILGLPSMLAYGVGGIVAGVSGIAAGAVAATIGEGVVQSVRNTVSLNSLYVEKMDKAGLLRKIALGVSTVPTFIVVGLASIPIGIAKGVLVNENFMQNWKVNPCVKTALRNIHVTRFIWDTVACNVGPLRYHNKIKRVLEVCDQAEMMLEEHQKLTEESEASLASATESTNTNELTNSNKNKVELAVLAKADVSVTDPQLNSDISISSQPISDVSQESVIQNELNLTGTEIDSSEITQPETPQVNGPKDQTPEIADSQPEIPKEGIEEEIQIEQGLTDLTQRKTEKSKIDTANIIQTDIVKKVTPPKVTKPDDAQEVTTPEVNKSVIPDDTVPEVTMPEVSISDDTAQEVTTPEVTKADDAQEVTTPKGEKQEVRTPKAPSKQSVEKDKPQSAIEALIAKHRGFIKKAEGDEVAPDPKLEQSQQQTETLSTRFDDTSPSQKQNGSKTLTFSQLGKNSIKTEKSSKVNPEPIQTNKVASTRKTSNR